MPRPMPFVAALVASGACATSQLPIHQLPPGPAPHPDADEPKSWAERLDEAREHEREAEEHLLTAESAEAAPATFACEWDPVLSDQLTSGTERLTAWTPCWDTRAESGAHQEHLARRQLLAAEEDREIAAELADRERNACGGLSSDSLARSPLSRSAAVERVVPLTEDGEVRGVRVVLEPAPGRDAASVEREIACHRARFAVIGMQPTYMPDDPTLVAGTRAWVTERDGRVEVTVLGDDDLAANVALGRATDLVGDQTAQR